MSDHEAFLRTIAERPDDDGPKLVYADWLDEHGDPRGELIRAAVELDHIRRRLLILPRLVNELAQHADTKWLRQIFTRFRVVLTDYPLERKIPTIVQIRHAAACSLSEAKLLSENLPAVIVDGVTWSVAERVQRQFLPAITNIEPSSRTEPLPATAPPLIPSFRIVLRSHLPGAKLQTIKALRSLTAIGVTAAREIVESLPRELRDGATFQDVERFRAAFRPFAEIEAIPMDIFC